MFSIKRSMFSRTIAGLVATLFLANSVMPSPAYAQAFDLPAPGLGAASAYAPVSLRAINIRENQPLVFDFVVDSGSSGLQGDGLKKETEKLAKYFLAAVTVPEKDLWVNLSPYENDRIIPAELGTTEMGREMLAQDAVLKQISAAATNPDSTLGKLFWGRVYAKAQETLGTTNIPLDTFNKIWIVPGKAKVYEKSNTALLGEATLKVMLDEDFLALGVNETVVTQDNGDAAPSPEARAISMQMMREVLVPEIEKMVNTAPEFATLRQFYGAMVLATWYKQALKESLIGQVYANQNKTAGVTTSDPAAKDRIYQEYLKQFKQGAYNFIKEEQDPVTGTVQPRQFFSGGENFAQLSKITERVPVLNVLPAVQTVGTAAQVTIALTKPEATQNASAAQGAVPVVLAGHSDVNVQAVFDRAQAAVSAGDLWGAYAQYRQALEALMAAKKAGASVDIEIAAVRARAVELMAEVLRHTDLQSQISQLKFALYSGPPAGGKGDIWKEFSSRYADIVDSFKLFHTRGIRVGNGESQGNPWNFRTESHLEALEADHLILTTLVNNQVQGLPLNAINDDTWVLLDEKGNVTASGVTDVEGLSDVFKGAKVRVLEGGFGWFLTLMDKGGYNEIATIFISPFTAEQIKTFETEGSKYKAMFEKAQELYRQELDNNRLMPQDEFIELTRQAGEAAAGLPFDDTQMVTVNGFKVGAIGDEWPGFAIKAGTAKDRTQPGGLEINVPVDGLFYAAAYETAKRLHGRQWKGVKKDGGDFKGKSAKALGFADKQNYLDRSFEAAVQVHTRNLYRTVLINGYQGDEAALREQMRHLTDEFAYTIFDALLRKIDLQSPESYVAYAARHGMAEADVKVLFETYTSLNTTFSFAGFLDAMLAEKRQAYLNSAAGGGISDVMVRRALQEQGALTFFNGDLNEVLLKMKEWQAQFKKDLGRDVTIKEMLTTDPDKDSSFELFQLLDEKGNLLNKVKPRALVHHDGDWHRDVRILVVDPTGKKVFIQKRGEGKDMEPGLLADSIGGHTRIGETYNENAVREAHEELKITVDTNRLFRLGGGNAVQRDDINNGMTGAGQQINRSHFAAYVYQLTQEEMDALSSGKKTNYDDGITPPGVISKRFFELAGMDADTIVATLVTKGVLQPLIDGEVGYVKTVPQWKVIDGQEAEVKKLFPKQADKILLILGLRTGWIPIDTFRQIGKDHANWVVASINKGFEPNGIYEQRFNAAQAPVGGIDLNAQLLNMSVERTGRGVKVTVDPALIREIRTQGVNGFAPVIINIMPVSGVTAVFGLSEAEAPVLAAAA